MDNNIIQETVEGIEMRMKETEEKFIFESIKPFAQEITVTEISKDELKKAIQLLQKLKVDNITIEECLAGAEQYEEALKKAYNQGFNVGAVTGEMKALEYTYKRG